MPLISFPTPVRAVVIGASGGVGAALTRALADDPGVAEVFAFARSGRAPDGPTVRPGVLDLADEASVARAAELVGAGGPADLVIVASGVLHRAPAVAPEKSFKTIDPGAMAEVLAVNTIGPALAAKHFLPLTPRAARGVFAALSARVGSIGDNRLGGWHSYRASKAALNMLLRNFALELARTRKETVVLGLHPGTVDTGLSAPFQAGVAPEKLFSPAHAASRLLAVIDAATPADSGAVRDWAGVAVPP